VKDEDEEEALAAVVKEEDANAVKTEDEVN
jgi:hypothetical protein